MDNIPLWLLGTATFGLVVAAIEAGYRLGRAAHRRSDEEKESPVAAITGAILGLLAFMLAFTFAMVADRYDARKALVRDEANAIRSAFLRADFLPEADRAATKALLREYVDSRLTAVRSGDLGNVQRALARADEIQRKLWETAATNARKDMNSDVAALYLESLNELIGLHALRVAVGLQARIPTGIWLTLHALAALGMLAVGYQTAIAGSKRSLTAPILALAFAIVITLVAALDRPQTDLIKVSQQPLADLLAAMDDAGTSR